MLAPAGSPRTGRSRTVSDAAVPMQRVQRIATLLAHGQDGEGVSKPALYTSSLYGRSRALTPPQSQWPASPSATGIAAYPRKRAWQAPAQGRGMATPIGRSGLSHGNAGDGLQAQTRTTARLHASADDLTAIWQRALPSPDASGSTTQRNATDTSAPNGPA